MNEGSYSIACLDLTLKNLFSYPSRIVVPGARSVEHPVSKNNMLRNLGGGLFESGYTING
ncbi:hypothetical protein D3C80_2037610 [compost metagenome]